MTFRLSRAAAAALLALSAAPALSGCLNSGPNKVQQMGNAMVGKPLDVAFQAFGSPNISIGPSPGGADGFYQWSHTRVSTGTEFVQTGQSTGSIVGMTQGGQGIASMPIYDNQPTGYYQQAQTVDYLCSIIVSTNAQNIIKEVTVAGCD
jgi:hypothetical protein